MKQGGLSRLAARLLGTVVWLCAAAALVPVGVARAQDVIALRPSVVLGGSWGSGPVTLKDIADLTGAQAEGLAGVVIERWAGDGDGDGWREIGITDIRAVLEGRDDINWGRLVLRGGVCSVRRGASAGSSRSVKTPSPGAAPDGPTVRGLVERRLAEALNVAGDNLRLTFEENDRTLLDTPTSGRTADIQMVGSSERQPVSVRLFEGLSMVASGTVRVGIGVRRTVAVSTVSLRRGEIVGAENLVVETRWVGPVQRPAAPETVAGMVVKARVEAGEMIEEREVEAPVIVKKGDLVDVYCLYGSVSLKSVVRAMEVGRVGETIRFQSPDSKRSFLARMDGPGRAVTGFPAGAAGAGVGRGTGIVERSQGGDGRTEAPVPFPPPPPPPLLSPTEARAGVVGVEVGGVRVTRSARPAEARRADALRLRLAELADKPLKKEERRP